LKFLRSSLNVTLISGARPNFMKVAPIIHAIIAEQERGHNIQYRLVHTGQHYDKKMSGNFFTELNIPVPNANLGCGGGTHAEQTAKIMLAFEKELLGNPSDLVLVVGDVTSTMACAITAKKLRTQVAHVEAGIRSFDPSMPEEINRIVTDSIADYFFTTTPWAGENLRKAGVFDNRIYFVGNVMIDTLFKNIPRLKQPALWREMGLKEKEYLILTMHRPGNVDQEEKLKAFMTAISTNTQGMPVIFPMHPRTRQRFDVAQITAPNIYPISPLGYLEFNYLVKHSKAVITDSGGITEETTVMNVPCLTLRDNTERPETIEIGTNELVGTDPSAIKIALDKLFSGNWKRGAIPEKWDGMAAERIVEILLKLNG